jgi:hypothetical protein
MGIMCGAAVPCRPRDTVTIIIARRTIGRLLTDTKNLPTDHALAQSRRPKSVTAFRTKTKQH